MYMYEAIFRKYIYLLSFDSEITKNGSTPLIYEMY